MKMIGVFYRRTDLNRQAFRHHYETRHALLGMTYFPFEKYVRNHVVSPAPGPNTIDCISEFYSHDPEESYAIMASATGDVLREDEGRFMERARIAAAQARECVLQGAPREVERNPIPRRIFAFVRRRGDGAEAFERALASWGRTLDVGGRRVTLDLISRDGLSAFPYDALVSLWNVGLAFTAPVAPYTAELRADFSTEVCESLPEDMRQRWRSKKDHG